MTSAADLPLVVVDAGCRWGVADAWLALGAGVRLYGFDADAEECRRLQAQAPPGVTYVPVGLGAADGPVTLYVTEEPACSSIFRPADTVIAAHPELEPMRLVRTAQIELRRLDGWMAEAGVDRVDAMKLDVQGAELAILEGAGDALRGVRMLEIEVAFNPFYEGQPLFGDIDGFLRRHGFELWRLRHLVHYGRGDETAPTSTDVQFSDSAPFEFQTGPGQLYWGHAYYFMPPRDQAAADVTALIASVMGFPDLATRLC